MKANKQLIHLLTRSAVEDGAIEPAEALLLWRQDAVSAISRLIHLSSSAKSSRLGAAIEMHKRAVIKIASSDSKQNSIAVELLQHMAEVVASFDRAIHRVKDHRHNIDPDRMMLTFWFYSQRVLREEGADTREVERVIRAASRAFRFLAEHALQFIPTVDPNDDPSAGAKLWMFYDGQFREYCAQSPVAYVWPAEASLGVHHDQCLCDEQTLRMALMCLQNPALSHCHEGNAPPFASVFGPIEKMKWPQRPPQHGPYIVEPPNLLSGFLAAVEVGAGLLQGPTISDDTPNWLTASEMVTGGKPAREVKGEHI